MGTSMFPEPISSRCAARIAGKRSTRSTSRSRSIGRRRSSRARSTARAELNLAFQRGRGGPGGWWILNEPELHLVPLEPTSPDICGWRVELMPNLPSTAYFELAPAGSARCCPRRTGGSIGTPSCRCSAGTGQACMDRRSDRADARGELLRRPAHVEPLAGDPGRVAGAGGAVRRDRARSLRRVVDVDEVGSSALGPHPAPARVPVPYAV